YLPPPGLFEQLVIDAPVPGSRQRLRDLVPESARVLALRRGVEVRRAVVDRQAVAVPARDDAPLIKVPVEPRRLAEDRLERQLCPDQAPVVLAGRLPFPPVEPSLEAHQDVRAGDAHARFALFPPPAPGSPR